MKSPRLAESGTLDLRGEKQAMILEVIDDALMAPSENWKVRRRFDVVCQKIDAPLPDVPRDQGEAISQSSDLRNDSTVPDDHIPLKDSLYVEQVSAGGSVVLWEARAEIAKERMAHAQVRGRIRAPYAIEPSSRSVLKGTATRRGAVEPILQPGINSVPNIE